jgi:hypothetical protein
MAIREQFEMTSRMRNWGLGLTGAGVVALLLGIFTLGMSSDTHESSRFWAVLLQNSVFFLLVVNAAMFFICATTLAMGGWQISFRRVPEAISALVPVFGLLAFIVLMCIVFGHQHHIFHWLDKEVVENDPILKGKSGFLNPTFFTIWTIISIVLWSFLGWKMRKMSYDSDKSGPMGVEEGKKWIFKNTVWASLFLVFFGLTVASTVPWLWIMSIDAHWFSTMFSWYTFASTFVSGMALIALFVVFLKNQGYLEYTSQEHLHDIGKFMFAFSIFWTYLWFSQFMLIWYANIPEETVYFKIRLQGPYRGLFFFNLIVNFVAPILILMTRNSKRNYFVITFMAVLIIFGHWIDVYLMVQPGVQKENFHLNWFDFGIAALYVGLIILLVGRALAKQSLLAKNHPFLKESIIHHT